MEDNAVQSFFHLSLPEGLFFWWFFLGMGCWGLFVLGVGFLVVFFFGGVGVCWVFGGGFWLGFGLVWVFFF